MLCFCLYCEAWRCRLTAAVYGRVCELFGETLLLYVWVCLLICCRM